jgi:general stress protein 26
LALVRAKDMEFKADDNQKIGQIIGSIQIGMLTTGLANGELRSRPMLCADFDFDSLWFLIKESQPVLAESMGNRVVNVTFASPEKGIYASVTGLAQLVEDEKMVQKLWRPEMKAWFPRGLEEPGLTLLRVDIDHAEAWDDEEGFAERRTEIR